jgi:putative transposase
MPPRLERRQKTGNTHFITFSCSGRNPYLTSSESKTALQRVIEETRNRYRFDVFGYVIMPEHVHLLLSEPELKPLLPRYYDFNVFTDAKRIEKLRYIHRNPVARGLVQRPEEYPWSSFRAYVSLKPNPITITRAV